MLLFITEGWTLGHSSWITTSIAIRVKENPGCGRLWIDSEDPLLVKFNILTVKLMGDKVENKYIAIPK